ncbi:hypothetical protein HYPSUDRAFT_762112 [Hypholoma sublateritium FD-334 SS-4]|uniref:Uncharacterized protein n=1 Tax=Hypholoma sublateritium (strain FD-334 SS-4) TaxID=945553 RepID=A0A0D2NXC6_HYPSF|nr:hypothetical protein HYPSUDRAFT_762112 [Hypholoma sublateritium FD-334 SS-4]
MSLVKLPQNILYDIFAGIVSEYIDTTIASPPRPLWLVQFPADVIAHIRGVLVARNALTPPAVGSDRNEWSGISEPDFVAVVLDEVKSGALDYTVTFETSAAPLDDDDDDDNDPGFLEFLKRYDKKPGDSDDSTSTDSVSEVFTDYQSEQFDSSDDEEADPGSDPDPERLQRTFVAWMECEAKEPLPGNAVAPLLCINGFLREIALRVLFDATGLKRARKKIFNKRLNALLHDVRMRFRIAHADPFMDARTHGVRAYDGPRAPLLDAYLALAAGTFLLRSFHNFDTLDYREADGAPVLELGEVLEKMQLIGRLGGTVHPESLRPWIAQRAHIFDVRYMHYLSIVKCFAGLFEAYKHIMRIGGTGDKPRFFVRKENAALLLELMDTLDFYDRESLDMEAFVEMPKNLAKARPLVFSLSLFLS